MLGKLVFLSLVTVTTLGGQSSGSVEQPLPASGPRCFNFSDATAFKITDPMRIRVSTKSGGDFDLDLMGAGCTSGNATLAIEKVPVADICTGAPPADRVITFKRDAQSSVACKIRTVSAASEKSVKKQEN